MTSDNAWSKFARSGNVADYLAYRELTAKEVERCADQHTGDDNQGYGGEK